ncbi:putative phototropic-resoponsive NPH3 family protein isoform X1 [Iris pallida]|uniref:Phototropic-resoponsive NPH3 family protein isoform X1 n=1 Tax=Iris pallida TaxID=29817 RepID=A0AAX6I1C8_IRIPA|nr:putative phototropic-resoponsive NPH3 family protein isoform X1 [Iris pallida]
MKEICDLKVTINGEHTFFLNQSIMCSFSAKLKELVEQQQEEEEEENNKKKKNNKNKKRRGTKRLPAEVKLTCFPGGAGGFETVSRFCYSSNGRVPTAATMTMRPSDICVLHSSAHLLGVAGLLAQAEALLDGLFYWTWDDLLASLRTCEPFLPLADSSGLLPKLISSLLAKMSAHDAEELTAPTPFPSSSPSSPDTPGSTASSSAAAAATKKAFLMAKEWWFDDLAANLPPAVVAKVLTAAGAYGADNRNLTLTRFLLHYLKSSAAAAAAQRTTKHRQEYAGLADTAVHGVVLMGRAAFSCRALFWVLRLVSGPGAAASRECRQGLERVIGLALDQATLDDLLVSGHGGGGVYDVNLVVRLVRVFVLGAEEEGGGVALGRLKKVGRLLDKYLREISPDHGLNVSRFLAVAESLPDSARDCFDGVYRALDIYLESHPMLSSEERATLCRCLNYEKLTLEACKDLAKNPRIPPGAAMQALVAQKSRLQIKTDTADTSSESARTPRGGAASATEDEADTASSTAPSLDVEKDELKLNLQKMQNRVRELEKVCLEMKSQMSIMVKGKPIVSRSAYQSRRGVTRFC